MESSSLPQLLPKDKGKEKVKEENEIGVKRNIFPAMQQQYQVEDKTQTIDSPPYAESSTARKSISTGKDKKEHNEDARIRIKIDPPFVKQEMDRIDYYARARSLAERAKPMCLIHKVHSGLRDTASAKHYEPVLVSIGPYHYEKTPLQEMEIYKHHYSLQLLDRVKDPNNSTDRTVERELEALKDEARKSLGCYRNQDMPPKMVFDPVLLVDCMVLDGCFMIELFRKNRHEIVEKHNRTLEDRYLQVIRNDMLFNIRWMKPRLARDMLLFENQIPLFVLRKLFALTEKVRPAEADYEFVNLVLKFFEFGGRPISYERIILKRLDYTPHLLGLVYNALVPETPQLWESENKLCKSIRTAVALKEVGVKFREACGTDEFYRIVFDGRVLSIPRLVIDDNTESFFRNLVAYEQYSEHYSLHRVADYLVVMDCLINSAKDVELLRHRGIIDNRIGDDVKVSTMFNKLCSGVYFDQNNFFYARMFDEVNKFCKKRRNVWMAKLCRDYFSSPWSVVKFLAASALLSLALMQTVFSGLSYYQPRS